MIKMIKKILLYLFLLAIGISFILLSIELSFLFMEIAVSNHTDIYFLCGVLLFYWALVISILSEFIKTIKELILEILF